MRRLIIMAMAAALSLAGCVPAFAGSIGATQAWVRNYVSNYVASVAGTAVGTVAATNGTYYSANGYSLFVEDQSVRALVVKRATPIAASLGYTNGCVFARSVEIYYWSVNGQTAMEERVVYRNGGKTILADEAATNFWVETTGARYEFLGMSRSGCWLASTAGGVTNLFCCLAGAMIQPSQAERIINGGDL